ncbi:MAG TPA: aromatic acid exporter family protein [Clostridiaceae bacterium]|nr:aromatic acid exporter family protein [Clostridiaceae bacterium]
MRIKYLGMRTFKTGLAVLVTAMLAMVIPNTVPFNIIFASVICMETSVVSSFQAGSNRVVGTFIGAIVSLVLLYLPIPNPIRLAVGVMLVIYICNMLNIKKSVGIGASIVILIRTGSGEVGPLEYTVRRILDTLLGIGVATLINMFISPPNQMKNVRNSFFRFRTMAMETVSEVLFYGLGEGIGKLGGELEGFKSSFGLLSEEISLLRKYEKEEIEYFAQMVEAAERVNLYTETIALMGKGHNVTADNNTKVKKILNRDFEGEEFADLRTSSREEIIYNYNLAKLLSAVEKLNKSDIHVLSE